MLATTTYVNYGPSERSTSSASDTMRTATTIGQPAGCGSPALRHCRIRRRHLRPRRPGRSRTRRTPGAEAAPTGRFRHADASHLSARFGRMTARRCLGRELAYRSIRGSKRREEARHLCAQPSCPARVRCTGRRGASVSPTSIAPGDERSSVAPVSRPRGCRLDGLQDEMGRGLRLGHERNVRRRDLHDRRVRALGHEPLELRRDRPVLGTE